VIVLRVLVFTDPGESTACLEDTHKEISEPKQGDRMDPGFYLYWLKVMTKQVSYEKFSLMDLKQASTRFKRSCFD
jgi:hypothetical protein